ncbi:MAG TPA: hypothetical protein VMZ03_10530 [Chitinophagaceae bacterium]|nr:hypothetical protein [Chitinophagaceae bacterium]
MKKGLIIFALLLGQVSYSQTVFGYWYGNANVKTNSSANNYLVELILQPEKGYVSGILNYFFKDTYRSLKVKGNYDPATRLLSIYDVPLVYHASISTFEVDCMMTLQATLRVAQTGSTLMGAFKSLPGYQYTCPEVRFNFNLNADISKKDSVMKAMSEYRETYQVWKPTPTDTLVATQVIPRKVINYVIEKEFTERKNEVISEIEVESDSIQVDVYDNGEIDGDIISLFYNQQLIMFNQKLTHRSIKINLTLDSLKAVNEISMFAENLGLIPPNTALMIINDGKTKYQTRVSSNLEKNAIIRIKRKTK